MCAFSNYWGGRFRIFNAMRNEFIILINKILLYYFNTRRSDASNFPLADFHFLSLLLSLNLFSLLFILRVFFFLFCFVLPRTWIEKSNSVKGNANRLDFNRMFFFFALSLSHTFSLRVAFVLLGLYIAPP